MNSVNRDLNWEYLQSRVDLAEKYLTDDDRVGSCALSAAVIETSLKKIISFYRLPIEGIQKCPHCGEFAKDGGHINIQLNKMKRYRILRPALSSYLNKCRETRNKAARGYFNDLKVSECKHMIRTAKELINWGNENIWDN